MSLATKRHEGVPLLVRSVGAWRVCRGFSMPSVSSLRRLRKHSFSAMGLQDHDGAARFTCGLLLAEVRHCPMHDVTGGASKDEPR